MKQFEEKYFTEVGFEKYEVLTIDVKKETFSLSKVDGKDLDKDAVVMDPKTFKALLLGLEQKFTKE